MLHQNEGLGVTAQEPDTEALVRLDSQYITELGQGLEARGYREGTTGGF